MCLSDSSFNVVTNQSLYIILCASTRIKQGMVYCCSDRFRLSPKSCQEKFFPYHGNPGVSPKILNGGRPICVCSSSICLLPARNHPSQNGPARRGGGGVVEQRDILLRLVFLTMQIYLALGWTESFLSLEPFFFFQHLFLLLLAPLPQPHCVSESRPLSQPERVSDLDSPLP